MNKAEIKKLVDVDAFFREVDKLVERCNCTYLDGIIEYGRRANLDLDTISNIVKSYRGKAKGKLTEQCQALNLIKPL